MTKVYALVFLIGIAIGICINYFWGSEFDLGDQLNIVDIISILATIFLAFYIPTVLDRNKDKKRFEREVLIKRVEALNDSFTYISKLVLASDSNVPLPTSIKDDILYNFTKLSNELKVFYNLLEELKINKLLKDGGQQINIHRRSYKRLVTGGNFDTSSFSFSIQHKRRESRLMIEINKRLSFMILEINSLNY